MKHDLVISVRWQGCFYERHSKLILKKAKENQIKGNHREICYRYGNDVQQQPMRHAITLSCQKTNIRLEVKHKSHFDKKSIWLQVANKHLSLTSLEIASTILQDSLPSDTSKNLTSPENARDAAWLQAGRLGFDRFPKPDYRAGLFWSCPVLSKSVLNHVNLLAWISIWSLTLSGM